MPKSILKIIHNRMPVSTLPFYLVLRKQNQKSGLPQVSTAGFSCVPSTQLLDNLAYLLYCHLSFNIKLSNDFSPTLTLFIVIFSIIISPNKSHFLDTALLLLFSSFLLFVLPCICLLHPKCGVI